MLVPVGCGVEIADEQMLPPERLRGGAQVALRRGSGGPLELKATCAPHYFRIVRQRMAAEKRQAPPGQKRHERRSGRRQRLQP